VKAGVSGPKYVRAADVVRERIADGTLRPGESAPSGAALATMTGYSVLTCRRALRTLVEDGTLAPGLSANARPRVPVPGSSATQQVIAEAARALSAGLASRRKAARLTQPGLAHLADCSVTTIGHAETGRLWQGRDFWERVDKVLAADGALLCQHEQWRAAVTPAIGAPVTRAAGHVPALAVAVPVGTVASVVITWSDGTVSVVSPPGTPARELGERGMSDVD
jgi:hypothetical protein